MTSAILRRILGHGVTIFRDGEMIRLRGNPDLPEEAIDLARRHKAALLEELQNPFWWNVQPDPADHEAIDWWDTLSFLERQLAEHGFELMWWHRAFLPVGSPSLRGKRLAGLEVVLETVRACTPILAAKAEHFPELTANRARAILRELEAHHMREGFRLKGWHGINVPLHWPTITWPWIQTLYVASLQTIGGQQ